MSHGEIHIMDIGARYGLHPTWKNFECKTYYTLIEADPDECKRLTKRYKKSEKFVKVLNYAVSKNTGYTDIKILENPAMSTGNERCEATPLFEKGSGREEQTKIKKIERVKNKSLDEIIKEHCERHPDFIKVDIEGMEYDVLRSLENYTKVLGIRCEINFKRNFREEKYSSFPIIHAFLEERGFMLVNLDYNGKGDQWSPYISSNQRYGSINTTDGVWIKDPKIIVKEGSPMDCKKLAAFLFNNHAPDLSIYILDKISEYKKIELIGGLDIYISNLLIKHLYGLKWIPGQKVSQHKLIYEKIFDGEYPELNKYNQSTTFNPIEKFWGDNT